MAERNLPPPAQTQLPFSEEVQLTLDQAKGKKHSEIHDKVLEYFNHEFGKRFRKSRNLLARIKEGASYEDCITVIENRRETLNDNFWKNHFYPEHLFRACYWESYLNNKFKSSNGVIDTNWKKFREQTEKP